MFLLDSIRSCALGLRATHPAHGARREEELVEADSPVALEVRHGEDMLGLLLPARLPTEAHVGQGGLEIYLHMTSALMGRWGTKVEM